jgi:hypothetical protein
MCVAACRTRQTTFACCFGGAAVPDRQECPRVEYLHNISFCKNLLRMRSGLPRVCEGVGCVDEPALIANYPDCLPNRKSRWNQLGDKQADNVSSLLTVDFFTHNDPIWVLSESLQCTIDFTMIGDRNLVEPGGCCRFDKIDWR